MKLLSRFRSVVLVALTAGAAVIFACYPSPNRGERTGPRAGEVAPRPEAPLPPPGGASSGPPGEARVAPADPRDHARPEVDLAQATRPDAGIGGGGLATDGGLPRGDGGIGAGADAGGLRDGGIGIGRDGGLGGPDAGAGMGSGMGSAGSAQMPPGVPNPTGPGPSTTPNPAAPPSPVTPPG